MRPEANVGALKEEKTHSHPECYTRLLFLRGTDRVTEKLSQKESLSPEGTAMRGVVTSF